MSAEQTPDIETVLAEHNGFGWQASIRQFACRCGAIIGHSYPDAEHRAHVAEALAPVRDAAVRDAKVEAWHEVEREIAGMPWHQWGRDDWRRWARDRADRVAVDAPEGGEGR